MKISEFNYHLPEELIAQQPPDVRGSSRLLVLHKTSGLLQHRLYRDLVEYLKPGDVVVLNDTKVIKARLLAVNNKGQQRELLLLEDHHNTDFTRRRSLYRGSLKADEILMIDDIKIRVTNIHDGGIADISAPVDLLDLAAGKGKIPLPPYMHREASPNDEQRYQTVFAQAAGSVAAPTASLNITQELLDDIVAKGATISYLTLHVGLGTFLPIRTDNIEQHKMHSEYFEISSDTVKAIQNAKRIVAVGTTVARTLEFCADELKKSAKDLSGEADIFIYPGYKFKIVDALLTNFHAPKSTVLMLAAAFAGWSNLMTTYQEAIEQRYAFLSYGDSMLILPD